MAEVKVVSPVGLMGDQCVNQVTIEGLKQEYPGVFERSFRHGNNKFFQAAKVCHKKTNWKTSPANIPWTISGINYNIGQVPHYEIDLYIQDLVKQGIIEEMKFGHKVFFSPIMFLRKASKTGGTTSRRW